MRQASYSILQRIFVFTLIFLLQLPVFSGIVFAGDSTSFNPVPIPVVAKGAGGVPVGTIIAWPVAQNPTDMENWLECNGQSISASVYPELVALVGGSVPDLRGLFLRGVGGNSASLGVQQGDAMRPVTGSFGQHGSASAGGIFFRQGGCAEDIRSSYGDWSANGIGFDISRVMPVDKEIRPVNKAVRYLIRALQ